MRRVSKDQTADPSGSRGRPAAIENGAGAETLQEIQSRLDEAEACSERAEAAGLDRETIATIGRLRSPDSALEELSLESLSRLFERVTDLVRAAGDAPDMRRLAWDLLNLVRRPALSRRIEPDRREDWAQRILALVDASHFTTGPLFHLRAEQYGSKLLFEFTESRRRKTMDWNRAAARVERLSRALLSLEQPAPVAILSENRIQMALIDLACLTVGLVDVMVPANATETDVAFILRHSGCRTLIVSGAEQASKVPGNRDEVPELRRVYAIDNDACGPDVEPLEALVARADNTPREEVARRSSAVRIGDLATVMYTSGTTGTPKGIQFSHRNIVFKRFARALALPEIGEDDVFLCFLPLFHTFGRFLEMMGCIFWGARYCFLDNVSAEGLVAGMGRHRPTVFISVPKKWTQLYEQIGLLVDPLDAPDAEQLEATRRVTGGRLAWGLSAAGHLDSEIFRFFQRQGVELLSGFGMTEATGGITMTPPDCYRDGSLGTGLPGIELRIAEDGELLVRGPYVMIGYLDPVEDEGGLDADGWLATGDLMECDEDGHLRLVDRKKEIYKNVKGETIAPQRVENHFRGFDSVARAFLVGDHREFNSLLIYPNPDYTELDFASMAEQEIRDHFRSLVISVNKFLAPYERIVDFAVIDRDLDAERGELTAKGTPRRKTVENNFSDVIRRLYRRSSLPAGGAEIVIPNWLFQILGLTARDIRCSDEGIALPSGGNRLAVRAIEPGKTQVGSCIYTYPKGPLNLGSLLTTTALWLGNEELVRFVPLDATTRQRPGRIATRIRWADRAYPFEADVEDRATLQSFLGRRDLDLLDLDLAARMLASSSESDSLTAVSTMAQILEQEEGLLIEPTRILLGRLATTDSSPVRRRAFQVLAPAESDLRFGSVARRFLENDPRLLDDSTRGVLCEIGLSKTKLESLMRLAHDYALTKSDDPQQDELAGELADFLAAYGGAHPVSYRRARAFLEGMSLFARRDTVRERAARATGDLRQGFRQWLGPADRIAVDSETRREYRWEDVVVFDDGVPIADRRRMVSALKHTPFLREGVFLFSGVSVRLSDIAPRGVWIRLAGSRHGKSVYRITVHTRFQGAFDLAANLNQDLPADSVREELQWLVLSGDPGNRGPLVEEFGGYWPEQDLWSEEYISGETLNRALHRLSEHADGERRLTQVWPFMAWATLSAYVDFWNRSGKRLEIAAPGMSNVVVPTEDFISGVRLVSLSRRRPHRGLLAMMRRFRAEFIEPAEQHYPVLAGIVDWKLIFSSMLEIVGEVEGLRLFREALAGHSAEIRGEMGTALRPYVTEIERQGFMPMRLYFAVERYRRWASLSSDPTPQARALTLQELYETYGLQRLSPSYPEIRVRFFLETVLDGSDPGLTAGLQQIIRSVRDGELASDELNQAVEDLRAKQKMGEDAEYFLARLSYPYLRPEDSAGFVTSNLGGKRKSEIVVTLEDHDGHALRVRHALSPKEVERLFRLFLAAKLDVRFHMEHQYLVAINERSQIVGGIYYEVTDSGASAHLEKIVVAERYRRKGVAHGLMTELFNRLRAAGATRVTTGFFRPEYFYGYGFSVEKRYAGLVKSLSSAPPT